MFTNTSTIITIIILILICIPAVIFSVKHLTGKGSCCGGGENDATDKAHEKELDNPIIGTKTYKIEGMTCTHCEKRVSDLINRIDGVKATANHKKGEAYVSYDREISDNEIKKVLALSEYKYIGPKTN